MSRDFLRRLTYFALNVNNKLNYSRSSLITARDQSTTKDTYTRATRRDSRTTPFPLSFRILSFDSSRNFFYGLFQPSRQPTILNAPLPTFNSSGGLLIDVAAQRTICYVFGHVRRTHEEKGLIYESRPDRNPLINNLQWYHPKTIWKFSLFVNFTAETPGLLPKEMALLLTRWHWKKNKKIHSSLSLYVIRAYRSLHS